MPIYEYRCQDCGRVSSLFRPRHRRRNHRPMRPLRQRRHGAADVVFRYGQNHGVGA